MDEEKSPAGVRPDQGVYAISVAATLVSTEIQNLRVYERHGLVAPARTAGGSRLYSPDDIERLLRVAELLRDGLNLAGVARVMDLEDELTETRRELERMVFEREHKATTKPPR